MNDRCAQKGSDPATESQDSGTLDDFVFPSRIDHSAHMSIRQDTRLVDEWVTGIGLRPEDYGTHSLRRAFPRLLGSGRTSRSSRL